MNVERPAWQLLVPIALVSWIGEWLPGVLGPYGLFIDEFYYLACASHLAWGYVDHPPLSIAMLAAIRAVAGDSLLVVRFVPAAMAASVAIATGLLARRLGAGAFGQALAAIAMVTAGVPMVLFSFYSMNALDVLLWVLVFHVLVRIEQEEWSRGWLVFGAVLGLGLQNKHTILLLLFGLLAGMLLTPARRHLKSPWFGLGLVIAGLIVLPNVLWQVANGWPSLEFYRNADQLKNNPIPPLEVLVMQILFMNPAAFVVWLVGLIFLLGKGGEGKFRHLAIAYVVLLTMLVVGQKSRPDRLTPMYPLLFAAGAAALEQLLRRRGFTWLRPVAIGVVVAGGLVFVPVGLPLLPPSFVSDYGAKLGLVPQIEAGAGKRSPLPQWLSDRLEWQLFVDDVVEVVESLPETERARAAIVAPSYGHAGALQLLGRDRGLPPVYSGHNNYSLWGPPSDSVTTLIVVGSRERDLRDVFAEVELAGTHLCRQCTPWRDEMPVWIVRGRTRPMSEIWGAARRFV